jgi:hypothetical protein
LLENYRIIGKVRTFPPIHRYRAFLLTDDAENAAFMVLTACRIWRFALESVHCSKAQAAQWALDRDPLADGDPAVRASFCEHVRSTPILAFITHALSVHSFPSWLPTRCDE